MVFGIRNLRRWVLRASNKNTTCYGLLRCFCPGRPQQFRVPKRLSNPRVPEGSVWLNMAYTHVTAYHLITLASTCLHTRKCVFMHACLNTFTHSIHKICMNMPYSYMEPLGIPLLIIYDMLYGYMEPLGLSQSAEHAFAGRGGSRPLKHRQGNRHQR